MPAVPQSAVVEMRHTFPFASYKLLEPAGAIHHPGRARREWRSGQRLFGFGATGPVSI